MAIWTDHLLPRVISVALNSKHARAIRARVCQDLTGDVLEIGAGSGLNAPFYPPTVTGVWMIEPSPVARKLAAKRIAATSVPVEYAGLDGQRLDLPDERFDALLSTWTLCTIPDADAALHEIRRVLKPGGAFHFVEHGRAPDAKVARFQDRVEPLHSRIGGGCKVTREFPALIERNGFTVKEAKHFYVPGEPKYGGYVCEGWALKS
jgi:ubiquinone/menaquinone biosynthesis C-methylase UbiE